MQFDQILVCCLKNISNMCLAQCWRQETSSRLFYDFIKMTIYQDLVIFNSWHLPFLNVSYSPFQKLKRWNLDIIGYLVIGAGCLIEKDLEPSSSPSNCSKDDWRLLPSFIFNSRTSLVTSWVVVQKIYSKMYVVSCTNNTHRNITDSVKSWDG